MVYNRHLVERVAFRKMKFGQRFMVTGPGGWMGPAVKVGRLGYMYSWSSSTGIPTYVAVSPTTTKYAIFPKVFEPYNGRESGPT